VVCALAQHAFGWPPRIVLDGLVYVTGALVLLSWMHYWTLWNARSHVVRRRQTP
jgi:hypothetical protein